MSSVPAPTHRIKGIPANTGEFIWSAQTVPLDTVESADLAANRRVYNHGAPKQVQNVNDGHAGIDLLVLFSCPETYGPSWIVGHFVATNMKAIGVASVYGTS